MSVLEEIYRHRLSVWSDIQSQMPLLYAGAASRPGCRVLELGVRAGNSTSALLAGAEAAGGRVWSVDIDDSLRFSREWHDSGIWSYICADDMAIDLGLLPDRVDVLFIDTSHTFEHTLGELRRFVPLVAPGGVVLMHDTLLTWDQPHYQVARALDAFCAETGREWTELSVPPYGLGQILHPNG